jgi:hypothetical protein
VDKKMRTSAPIETQGDLATTLAGPHPTIRT